MSYFDDASLVMIPSGYKDQKVYSVKPIDGSGDLTFTRSNDTASRIGPDSLIEKVRTNRYLYSEQFDNAAWLKTFSSVTANSSAAPNGTTTADKGIPDTSTNYHPIGQTLTGGVSGAEYAFSVYAKADGYNFLLINTSAGSAAGNVGPIIDLSNGTIAANFGGNDYGAQVTSVGSGWYRISFSYATNATTTSVDLNILPTSTIATYAGDGTSGVLFWGAQYEAGVATPYIGPTLAAAVSVGPVANVPRLDYLNSSCPRLLLEPQRTNKQTYSEQINTTNYAVSNEINVTANAGVSPDGYTNADKIIPTTTSVYHQVRSDLATVSGYDIVSVFVKASGYNYVQIASWADPTNHVNFDLTDGTVGTVSVATIYGIQSYGNGWYRVWANVQASGAGIVGIGVVTSKTAGWAESFAGNGTDGVLMWGVQIEDATYPSSYIGPTLGAAVTRGADIASKTGITSLIGQTEGTIFFDGVINGAQNNSTNIVNSEKNTTCSFYVQMVTSSSQIHAGLIFSGTTTAAVNGGTIVVGQRFKVAWAYKSGSNALYINGILIDSNTTTFTPPSTFDDLFLGDETTYFGYQEGLNVHQALLFKTRLSNADLAALTA